MYSWTKPASDIFHYESSFYLLIVDYTIRFSVAHTLSSMTCLHVTNQCKQIFSEYGLAETLISDNGPCYTSQAFTSVMQSYNNNHITSSLHYPQSNCLAEKYVQIVKSLFYKVKEEGKDFYRCLMIYCNTPFTCSLQSPMQILQGRNARSDLPVLKTARKQLCIQPEVIRNTDTHAALPTHDLHLGQQVMFQDSTNKCWYPGLNESLCPEPRSYKITTRDGIVYRKTQAHLKPFTPQNKNLQSSKCVSPHIAQYIHMWPVKAELKKKSQVNNQMQVQTSRPKWDTKPPVKLDL